MLEKKQRDSVIDEAEVAILDGIPVTCQLTHRFTEGMYIREIFMPKGTLLTSRIHKSNHPFVISKGKCQVYDGDKVKELQAPYTGITEPNTRRLIYIEEDTVWVTFHITDKTNLKEIEEDILINRENELIEDKQKFEDFHKTCVLENVFSNKTLEGRKI